MILNRINLATPELQASQQINKIKAQMFFSTKKQTTKKQNSLSKPTVKESLDISCSLLLSSKPNSKSS